LERQMPTMSLAAETGINRSYSYAIGTPYVCGRPYKRTALRAMSCEATQVSKLRFARGRGSVSRLPYGPLPCDSSASLLQGLRT
jgi:hypothetical protein